MDYIAIQQRFKALWSYNVIISNNKRVNINVYIFFDYRWKLNINLLEICLNLYESWVNVALFKRTGIKTRNTKNRKCGEIWLTLCKYVGMINFCSENSQWINYLDYPAGFNWGKITNCRIVICQSWHARHLSPTPFTRLWNHRSIHRSRVLFPLTDRIFYRPINPTPSVSGPFIAIWHHLLRLSIYRMCLYVNGFYIQRAARPP